MREPREGRNSREERAWRPGLLRRLSWGHASEATHWVPVKGHGPGDPAGARAEGLGLRPLGWQAGKQHCRRGMPRFDPSWEEAGQEGSPENTPPEGTWRETGENPDQPADSQAMPSLNQAETQTLPCKTVLPTQRMSVKHDHGTKSQSKIKKQKNPRSGSPARTDFSYRKSALTTKRIAATGWGTAGLRKGHAGAGDNRHCGSAAAQPCVPPPPCSVRLCRRAAATATLPQREERRDCVLALSTNIKDGPAHLTMVQVELVGMKTNN